MENEPLPEDYCGVTDTVMMGYEEIFSKMPDTQKTQELMAILPQASGEAAAGVAHIQMRVLAIGRKNEKF